MKKILLALIMGLMFSTNAYALDESLKNVAFERTTKISSDFSGESMIGTATYLGSVSGTGYWITAGHVVYDHEGLMFINSHVASIVDAGYFHHELEVVEVRRSCTEEGCIKIPEKERIPSDHDWAIVKTEGYSPAILPTMITGTAETDEPFFYVNVMKYETVNKIKYINKTETTMNFTMMPECGNSGAGVFNYQGQLVGIVAERQCNPRMTIVTQVTAEVLSSFLNGV